MPKIIKKRHRLTKLAVKEISLVRSPANEHSLVKIVKSAGGEAIEIDVAERDEDERRFAGWASVIEIDGAPVEDSQGDSIDLATLRAAAEAFVSSSRAGAVEHDGETGKLVFTESIVFDGPTQAALGIDLKRTGWWVGGYVEDDATWRALKAGRLTGLSVGGVGVRIAKAARPAARSGYLTLAEAYARTAPPSREVIAQLVAKSRTPASTAPRKAAFTPAQQAAPQATAPTRPRASTAGVDAARAALKRATSPQQGRTDTTEAERIRVGNDGILRIAAKVDAASAARLAIRRMTGR